MVEAGLPLRLAGSLERGERPLKSAAVSALARALDLPERWFTEPLDVLLGEREAGD